LSGLAAWQQGNRKKARRFAQFVAVPINVADELIVKPSTFPPDWDATPPSKSTRAYGNRFLDAGRHPVVRAPSTVRKGEFCFVLNPLHPDFEELKIGKTLPFNFDPRTIAR